MYEVYFWDDRAGRFAVHGAFGTRGGASEVAGRLTRRTGHPHFVRFRTG